MRGYSELRPMHSCLELLIHDQELHNLVYERDVLRVVYIDLAMDDILKFDWFLYYQTFNEIHLEPLLLTSFNLKSSMDKLLHQL